MPTFETVLTDALRADPGRPVVTFYDEATGERVELSVTTFANWVAKTVNLAQDELDLARGERVYFDLPTHWLGAVWLGAALTLGLEIVGDADGADLVVCGPEGVTTYAGGGHAVVALSLRPMGARFAEPLPTGVVDFGAEVFAQPDALFVSDRPGGDDLAYAEPAITQHELASGSGAPSGRVLTDTNPLHPEGASTFIAALRGGAGMVWLVNADEPTWARRAEQERATRWS